MKKKFLYAIPCVAALFFMTGCEDQLDIWQHSVSEVSSYYKTDSEAEEGIVAVYDAVKSLNSGFSSLVMVLDMLDDDCWTGGGNHYDGDFHQIGDYTFGSDYGAISTIYSNLYKVIYRANVVIENVNGDSEVMKRAVAEARVLRAFANFELVTLWGSAPLVQHTLSESEYMQSNSTPEALWAAIEEDLNTAISSGALSQKKALSDKNYRATKQFAQALLGKAFLFQKKYSEAAAMLDNVVNSGLYSLPDDYSLVNVPGGEGSAESVFEIHVLNDPSNSNVNNNFFWTMQGLRGEKYSYQSNSPFASATWGYINPTKDLYDDFVKVEGADGYRLKNSVITRDQLKNEYGTVNIMDITDNEGLWNFKTRILKKYWAGYFYANDWRIMRYSEVLLLDAEAQLQGGNPAKAAEYLNVVRNRAKAPHASSVTLEDIQRESRIELCFEGLRFQNLVRWGLASKKLSAKGTKNPILKTDGSVGWEVYNENAAECGFKEGKHELLPFPATEIAVNPNIKQNPKW